MELSFEIGGVPALFLRNEATGRAELRVGDEVRRLQSPWRLSTHISLAKRTVWREVVGEHTVEVEKVRPRMFGGVRANSFVVSVDGQRVVETTGR